MKINKIEDIYIALRSNVEKKKLVVAFANDEHSIEAAYLAIQDGLIKATLVGDKEVIARICSEQNYDMSQFTIIHEPVEVKAAVKAVEHIREGEGDFLMKGLVTTDKFMRAVLNKEKGIVDGKTVISHVAVLEHSAYPKLLAISDAAVIPYPELAQKQAIIGYLTGIKKKLGEEHPKIALIAPSEQVLPKVQASLDAAILSKMSERGQLGDALVEGPLALDVAINKEAARIKKIKSEVAGNADCLVFSNLEAGNVFYKTMTNFGGARVAATLVGAKVPCVLSSRGDSVDAKLNSIALSAFISK